MDVTIVELWLELYLTYYLQLFIATVEDSTENYSSSLFWNMKQRSSVTLTDEAVCGHVLSVSPYSSSHYCSQMLNIVFLCIHLISAAVNMKNLYNPKNKQQNMNIKLWLTVSTLFNWCW